MEMGWVELVYNMLWVGLGFKKLTHVHVWVGGRLWSIVQWPWMIPNPYFMGTLLFYIKYLRNDTRQTHGYYWPIIIIIIISRSSSSSIKNECRSNITVNRLQGCGTRVMRDMRPTELCHWQWHLATVCYKRFHCLYIKLQYWHYIMHEVIYNGGRHIWAVIGSVVSDRLLYDA